MKTVLTDTACMVESLEKSNVVMDSKLEVQSTVADRLVDRVNELRQYSRRTNLLTHGVPEEESDDNRGSQCESNQHLSQPA